MARERESTRSRERERDTSTTRTSRGGGSGSGAAVAINFDPSTFETYGLWGDRTDVEILDAWVGIYNYGGKLSSEGKVQISTSLFINYLDEETGEEHTEQVSAGSPKFYAPGNSPNEEDYAGGTADDFKGLQSGDTTPNDDMRGEYMLPVAQGYDDAGNPIYKQLKGSRGSNMDFYLHQLGECCKAAGIPLTFNAKDPNVRDLLIGFRGTLDRMSNTLRKGPGAADTTKNKVLVFGEIFERKEAGKGKAKSNREHDREKESPRQRSRANGRDEDAEEKPATRTRSRREGPAEDSDADAEPETRPARRGKKGAPSGPTADFLSDFAEKVEALLSDSPGKKIDRTKLTRLTSEYETREEADWVIGLATEDSDEVMEFWQNCELFDYSSRTNTVSL